jgi:hypothetical protein
MELIVEGLYAALPRFDGTWTEKWIYNGYFGRGISFSYDLVWF